MEPLSPFETLLLVDRRRGYPMDFLLEVQLEGPLDRGRLEAAVAAAAACHPRMRMRIGRRGRRWVWLPPDSDPSVEWWPLSADRAEADPWRPCDATRSSGLRVVALERERDPGGPPRWSVVLVVDHTVCDGLACVEWLGVMWTAYHTGQPPCGGDRPAVVRRQSPAAPETSVAPLPAAPDTRRLARDSGSFARLRPAVLAPLATPTAPVPDEPLAPPYACVVFTPDQTRRLWGIASAAGVTVNDLLVAAAMRTALEWNAAAGTAARHVRINMPVSLRAPGATVPTGNHIGYAFLDRSAEECGDPTTLVRSLAAASRWIKETGAAAQFLHAVEALERVPGLLWLLTRLPLCLSTAVISNVGNLAPRLRAAVPIVDGRHAPRDLLLTGIVGVPPLRPRTRAGVGIMTYAGSLRLAVHTDERHLGAGASAAFAEFVRRAIDDTAAALAASTPGG